MITYYADGVRISSSRIDEAGMAVRFVGRARVEELEQLWSQAAPTPTDMSYTIYTGTAGYQEFKNILRGDWDKIDSLEQFSEKSITIPIQPWSLKQLKIKQ